MSTSARRRKPESPVHKFRGGVRTECGENDADVRWTRNWGRTTCPDCKDRRLEAASSLEEIRDALAARNPGGGGSGPNSTGPAEPGKSPGASGSNRPGLVHKRNDS